MGRGRAAEAVTATGWVRLPVDPHVLQGARRAGSTGDLISWTKQGVMLLNRALTLPCD